MIDNFAIFNIAARIAITPLLIIVMRKQLIEIKKSNDLLWLKRLLFALVFIIFLGNTVTLCLNLFRDEDGNLMTRVRHFSLVFNGIAIFATGWVLHLIYKHRSDV